jgi:hypothetical protein
MSQPAPGERLGLAEKTAQDRMERLVENEKLLTLEEVSRSSQMTLECIELAAGGSALPHVTVGDSILFRKSDVIKWLETIPRPIRKDREHDYYEALATRLVSDIFELINSGRVGLGGRDRRGRKWIGSTELASGLAKIEGAPWSSLMDGYPITTIEVAKLLRIFRITPRKFRSGERTINGYFCDVLYRASRAHLPILAGIFKPDFKE